MSEGVSPTSPFYIPPKVDKVSPTSVFYVPPQTKSTVVPAKSPDKQTKQTGGGPTTSTAPVFDPNAVSAALDAKLEGKPTNPPFIYPGTFTVGMFNNQTGSGREVNGLTKAREVKRGYIRRLTEHYAKVANSSTLNNLRCNFQFNPANITRSIESNSNLQLFFNQEPSQLAQPIPGNAGFAFELTFNREAELNSGTYLSPNGQKIISPSTRNRLTTNPEIFINEDYDPSWVTEIGVLADIMVLDDIVGQGLAKDILKSLQSGGGFTITDSTTPTEPNEDENSDETDKANSDNNATWNKERLNEFSTNLGNKAFLVPSPVRILFSPWLMVEGFVMTYSVIFNKFTPEMVPSHATVAIQMQALYVGFAQQKTMLTEPVPAEITPGTEADAPAPGTEARIYYDQTKAALATYITKAAHIQGKNNALDLINSFFNNEDNRQEANFIALVSPAGKEFYESSSDKDQGGGGLSFTVRGEMKVSWHSHVSNASNSREAIPKNAVVTGGNIEYTPGPPTGTVIDYTKFGTQTKPLIISLEEIPVYYERGDRLGLDFGYHLMILGQIRNGNALRVVNGNWNLNSIGGIFFGQANAANLRFDSGEPAFWTIPLTGAMTKPFNQDKFNVSLTLTLTATRFGQAIQSEQKIVGNWVGITADDDVLFNNLSITQPYKGPTIDRS